MPKSINYFKNDHYKFFTKLIYACFALSVLVIFLGVAGIIEHKSPQNMENVVTLSAGFITHFEYHLLILLGALIFTFAAWLKNDASK